MKINPFNRTGLNPYNQQLNKVNKQPKKDRADKVEISSAAKEMQQIKQIDIERRERIEELKINIENGTYQVDPKLVAKGIANFFQR